MIEPLIPDRCLFLLSGIPATGKSYLGRYLARVHAFAHYDLECYPLGWPHPELKVAWDSSRMEFVNALRALHPRVVLDWGFPVGYVTWVRELLAAGARLIWFAGSAPRAREIFIARAGIDVQHFDAQLQAIQKAGLPASLQCDCVEALSGAGILKEPAAIVGRSLDSEPNRQSPTLMENRKLEMEIGGQRTICEELIARKCTLTRFARFSCCSSASPTML